MKRFFRFLLLAAATILAARAQSVNITSPTGSTTSPVTITGTTTGFSASATGPLNVVVTTPSGSTTTLSTTVTGNASWTITWAPSVVGNYTLQATFAPTSPSGIASVQSLAVSVTLIGPPSISSISLAGGGATLPVGASRFVNVTATAAGAIDHVEFYLDAVLFGSSSSPASGNTFSMPFTAPTVTGSHQINAKVYDSAGNTSNSSFLSILVTTPIGAAPAVGLNTPINGAFLPTGVATTVSGSVSDTDGTISSVLVFMNGVSLGSATVTGGSWTLSWTPSVQGAVSLSAIATDDRGNASQAPAVAINVTDNTSPAVTLTLSPNTAALAASSTLPSGATRNILATVAPSTGRAVVRVEFFVNGTKVGEKTTAPFTYRFTAPAATGTYVFSARATDNTSLARDAQQVFTVTSAAGSPPTVNLLTPTSGTTVVPNTAVNLAASALAVGGTISSVQFYVNGSPASVNAGNGLTAAPYTSTFTPTAPGTYVIDAIATDDRGNNTISNTVTINSAFGTPTVAITAPNVNATARATPNVPLTISATAQGGSGAAVLLVEYLLDGAQIGTRTIGISTGLNVIYSFSWTPTVAQLGLHQITARVTDTNSLTATSAPVNVNVATVVGTPPAITVSVSPVPAQGLQTLSTVNFLASAFANGANSTISSVEFFLNDSSIGLAAREQSTNLYRLSFDFSRFDFSALTPDINTGRYALTLYAIAKDSNSNQSISTTTTLSFNPSVSAPPTVQLTSLGGNAVTQNTQFPLLATPNDTDGTVSSIQLFANGALVPNAIITSLGAQTLITYPAPTAGRFNLYAVVIDDSGNSAVSTPSVVLNVTALGTPSTVVTRPTDDSTVTSVGSPVFLEATASSPDTTGALTVQFVPTASSGARGTAITATRVGTTTTYRAVFTTNTADTYTITSTATFNGVTGNSANSRRVVVSNIVGIAPTITISTPATITSGSTSNLIATATSSSGSIASVEFFVNRNSIGQAVRDQLTNTWRLNTSFIGLSTGNNEVVALARDSSGNVAPSATGNINITAGTGVAPSCAVFASSTSIALGQSVVLSATASSVTGTVTSVTYFANATNLASRTTPPSPGQAGYVFTWTNAPVGTSNVYVVATDSNGNTNVSAPITITVRRFTPLIDDNAFVLQTYVDISNNSAPNLILAASYADQLTAGTLTRGQLVNTLTNDNGNGFNAPVNLLSLYYVLMGQWPTPTNYSTLITGFRNNLAGAVANILASPEYVAKYPEHITPTAALLSNPASVIPASIFEQRIWANAGLPPPTAQQDLAFRNNTTATATLGRGYTVAGVGLNTAIAEFITNTNSTNLALRNLGEAAALFFQLDKPPTTMTTDEIATRIAAIAKLPDTTAQADAVLKDILYTYRYTTILDSPKALVVAPRSGALFSVSAIGAPPLNYQWLFNGAPISGVTNPTALTSQLSLTNISAANAGTYTVLVTTTNGSATSDPATLTLSTAVTKLGNISTRGVTGSGGQLLIAGFVVTNPVGTPANQTRQMLIRVVGPGLAAQGFNTNLLTDPRLEVYGPGSATVPILINDNWGTQTANAQTNATAVTAIQQAATRTGAFVLPNTASADAVVLATLAPGNYTVQAKGPNNASTGVVLVEVYDATPNSTATTPKPVNVSTRGPVGTGANSLIAGFVINGTVSRRVLIRGVGPTLANFGLGNAGLLADPQLELFDSTNKSLRTNNDWATGDDAAVIAAAAVSAGAFPLSSGSKDAAMLIMLPPGAYTVHLTGVGGTTGIGLVEVYDVDP